MENLYTPSSIRTFTPGNYLDFSNLNPDNILIEDIAHALSLIPRFGGHTPYFYSVARHSSNIAKRLAFEKFPKEIIFQGLMHDSSEAFLIDIPSPIKKMLPDYLKLEKTLMEMIAKKFNFSFPLNEVVKQFDKEELEWEWNNLIIENNLLISNSEDDEWEFLRLYQKYK